MKYFGMGLFRFLVKNRISSRFWNI